MKTGIEELFYVGGFLGKEIEDKRKTILRVEEELLGKKGGIGGHDNPQGIDR